MANGNIDPSQLSAFGQYLLSGQSDLRDEDLQNAIANEVALGGIMSQADAAREEAVAAQEQPTTPSFSMNPFGASSQSIPFLFGEDPASQEARESFQSAGDVAQQVIGLKDPRSPEAQQEMEMVGGAGPLEAFLPGGLITKGPKIIGGLQKLSRFKPSTPPKQLPVLRGGQKPAVTGSQVPATVTTPPSTLVRGTGPKRVEGTVVNPLATTTPKTGGGIIPSLATLGLGGALVTDQLMQDPSQEQGQMATAPEGVVPTQPQPTLTTVPGLESGFGGMALSEFLAPDRAKQEAARSSFAQASREREARLAADEFARSEAGRRLAQEQANKNAKFRALARQKGFKGSAVNAAAELLMAEEERKAAESVADIAAAEALTASRLAPKPTTLEKDLADIESRFLQVGVPFRDAQGNLTEAAQIALLQKGRISEIGTIGSGLEETILLDRQGNQRRVPNDQVEEALASGYTRFVDEA